MGIKLKRSSTAGKAPVAGDLEPGELAVNTWDGKLYLKKNDGADAIVEVGPVRAVAGKTGAVTLVKADVSLGDVDNTSDAAKPISSATQTALNGKANNSHGHAIADVTGLQTALDGKAPLASPALTGTPTAPSPAAYADTTQIATTAQVYDTVTTVPGKRAGRHELHACPLGCRQDGDAQQCLRDYPDHPHGICGRLPLGYADRHSAVRLRPGHGRRGRGHDQVLGRAAQAQRPVRRRNPLEKGRE
jgi:hypothetical protein